MDTSHDLCKNNSHEILVNSSDLDRISRIHPPARAQTPQPKALAHRWAAGVPDRLGADLVAGVNTMKPQDNTSKGTEMASETRAKANQLTREERLIAHAKAMQLIYDETKQMRIFLFLDQSRPERFIDWVLEYAKTNGEIAEMIRSFEDKERWRSQYGLDPFEALRSQD